MNGCEADADLVFESIVLRSEAVRTLFFCRVFLQAPDVGEVGVEATD
jgi:hypothetical protein